MGENYIQQFWAWSTGDTLTATRLNGNVTNLTDGLSGGVKALNIGKMLVNGIDFINSSLEITGVTSLTVDNILINGNTISSTSGSLNLTPFAGSAAVIDSHFSFDGTTLTGATDANTTLTAYTGRAISIEGSTFDGGVGTIPTLLVGTTTNTTSLSTMYVVTGSGAGVSIKTHNNNVGISMLDQYDSAEYFYIYQKNQGGAGQSAVELGLKASGTKRIILNSQPAGLSYFNTDSGQYVFGAATATSGTSKVEIHGESYLNGIANIIGNFSVNTNKFTVTAASGNTSVAGTLGVTGATTLSSTLNVVGDFSVATSKLTVASATGNTSIAGNLTITNQPRVSLLKGSSQSINNTTLTAVTFSNENTDPTGMHDTGSNTSRITISKAGTYIVTTTIPFSFSSSVGDRYIELILNGSSTLAYTSSLSTTTLDCTLTLSIVYTFSANDYIEIKAYQTSGGALNVNSGATFSAAMVC